MLELDWVNGGQVTAGANHLPLTAAGHAPARKEEARGAVFAVPQGSKEVSFRTGNIRASSWSSKSAARSSWKLWGSWMGVVGNPSDEGLAVAADRP